MQIRERILTEQQARKQYVDDYLTASSQPEFNESKPHFAHVKSQFEKKNARSQAVVNQLQAKLKRATEKLTSLERVQRDLARSHDQYAVQFDMSKSLTPMASTTSGSSSPPPNSPSPAQPAANVLRPTVSLVHSEEVSAQPPALKRPPSSSALIKQAASGSRTATTSLQPSSKQTAASLKHPASSTSLRQTSVEAQQEPRATSSQNRVINTVVNLIHLAQSHSHALSKHHSNSTNALSNRKVDEQNATTASPSRKSPVTDK